MEQSEGETVASARVVLMGGTGSFTSESWVGCAMLQGTSGTEEILSAG